MHVLTAWLGAFLFGQAIEVPIYSVPLGDRPVVARLVIAFGATAITHPFVWFVFPAIVPGSYVGMAILAEAFAVGVETIYLRCFGVSRALGWSVLANGSSLGLGLLSRHLFGWP